MYQLFHQSPLNFGGGLIFPEFRRVQDGLRLSVRRIKEYRRNNPRYLPGGHLLLRLLHSIPVAMKMSDKDYNDRITDNALLFTQSLRMTSALSKGQIWRPGAFLGRTSAEAIIANVDSWDVEAGLANWQELAPIRYLWHPMSSLELPLADGQFATPEAGLSVITINVPMLASQYRRWRMVTGNNEDSPRSMGHFLQAYPIPNMLDSQVDIAVLNRLINRYFKMENSEEDYRHPFYLTDWSTEVDRVLDKFLIQAGPKRWDFDTLVSHIPTVCSENLHHVLKLPEMPYSTQLQWAVFLSRLALVTFLVQYNRATDNERNQKYLDYIRRWLMYMDGNTSLRSAVPLDIYEDTTIMVESGIRPFLR